MVEQVYPGVAGPDNEHILTGEVGDIAEELTGVDDRTGEATKAGPGWPYRYRVRSSSHYDMPAGHDTAGPQPDAPTVISVIEPLDRDPIRTRIPSV